MDFELDLFMEFPSEGFFGVVGEDPFTDQFFLFRVEIWIRLGDMGLGLFRVLLLFLCEVVDSFSMKVRG
jgi:hypothetical protein